MAHSKIYRFIVALFLAAVVGMPLFGEDLFVDYLVGYVEVEENGEWYELMIGDTLSEEDMVRLEADAVLEISGGGSKITLTRAGTYKIAPLVNSAKEQDRAGVGTLLSGKMKTMFGKQETQTQSTVAGVRGAEAEGGGEELQWIEGEVDEFINEGKRALEDEEYTAALTSFQEGYSYALDPEEENKALFFVGYTYAMMGKTEKALDTLTGLDVAPEAEYYYDYYFVTGKLLIDTFAYQDAADFLTTFNDIYADATQKQVIAFLTGVAYNGAGSAAQAEEYLKAAFSSGPDSDIGRAAQTLYEQLN